MASLEFTNNINYSARAKDLSRLWRLAQLFIPPYSYSATIPIPGGVQYTVSTSHVLPTRWHHCRHLFPHNDDNRSFHDESPWAVRLPVCGQTTTGYWNTNVTMTASVEHLSLTTQEWQDIERPYRGRPDLSTELITVASSTSLARRTSTRGPVRLSNKWTKWSEH